MTAAILVCHYLKHGMTCGLSWYTRDVLIILGVGLLAVLLIFRQSIDHKGAG